METTRKQLIRVQMDPAVVEVLQGQVEIHGDLEIVESGLVFSYQTKNILGKFSEGQHLEIPFADLSTVVLKRGIISPKIIVRPRQLGVMKQMPGEHRSHMVFKVSRHDRSKAGAFVSFLQGKLHAISDAPTSSIPFTIPSTNMGFTEHEGLLYLEDEFLVFDLQSGFPGGQKDDRHLIKIETSAVKDMQLKPGAGSDRLFIWPKKEALLEAMPGNHQGGKIKLTVKRKHREALEKMLGVMLYG